LKKEVIIISDMWGAGRSNWLNNFQHGLLGDYKIKFYDACKLGQIDINPYEEENLHQQFLDFGIENAIKNLIRIEKEARTYITCSIGGVMAWKAALAGLPIERLIAISPTRLRLETETPNCNFQLFYGRDDESKPDLTWLEAYAKGRYRLLDGDHQLYKDKEIVQEVLNSLIQHR